MVVVVVVVWPTILCLAARTCGHSAHPCMLGTPPCMLGTPHTCLVLSHACLVLPVLTTVPSAMLRSQKANSSPAAKYSSSSVGFGPPSGNMEPVASAPPWSLQDAEAVPWEEDVATKEQPWSPGKPL